MSAMICAKCGGTSFKSASITPADSRFKLTGIVCRSCGAPAGVMDYFNIGQLIQEQNTVIDSLKEEVMATKRLLEHLAGHLMK